MSEPVKPHKKDHQLANEHIDRFSLLSVLGEGGMGTVYLARDPVNKEEVALKLLTGGADEGGMLSQRFERECLALGKINHPNVVQIHESGRAGTRLYYTMEYIDGLSIERLVQTKGPLPIDRAVTITRDLADGVAAIHEADLLHRDIKPANVIIARSGRAVLTDFGLVKVGWLSNLTQTNVFVGTYQYAAPEVLSGLPPRPRSDVYQLGLLCYIMLTGEILPFGRTLQEIARKLMVERLNPPSVLRAGISSQLDNCVMRAIARDPEDRFETAEELRDALDRAQVDLTTSRRVLPRPALHQPRQGQPPAQDQSEDWLALPAYLSGTAIHLLLVLSIIYCAFAAAYRLRANRRPLVAVPVALAWIGSEWDALSYNTAKKPNRTLVINAIKRMQWADSLVKALNERLPRLLERGSLEYPRFAQFLLKAEHSLRLAEHSRTVEVDYQSPATQTLQLSLHHLVRHIRQAKRPAQVLEKLRLQLLQDPGFDRRVDRLFTAAQLPTANTLLMVTEAIIELTRPGLPRTKRTALCDLVRSVCADSRRTTVLTHVFGPLIENRSIDEWIEAQRIGRSAPKGLSTGNEGS